MEVQLAFYLQDPFDADEFVERLAWRTMGGHSRSHTDNFDPVQLHSSFERTIRDLKDLHIEVIATISPIFNVECHLLNPFENSSVKLILILWCYCPVTSVKCIFFYLISTIECSTSLLFIFFYLNVLLI